MKTSITSLALCALWLLGGCAHYTPLPLPEHADFAAAPIMANDGTPLGIAHIVALALEQNPDLKAARAKRGIAKAQLLQSGILPNPAFSGSFLPLLSGDGTVPGWSIGLTQDIRSLITYRSRKREATFGVEQVDAEILWQEWQVAGQARQIAADLIMGERMRDSYVAIVTLMEQRNARSEAALRAGNATLATLAPDRSSLQAARAAFDGFAQRQLALRHQLNALLGLAPDAMLPLVSNIDLPPFDPDAIRGTLPNLANRRPDLIALQMGYAQADERVRQAIQSQFPDLVLGGSMSSDNSKVINGGPSVGFGLPLFDRNQGNIAIARATRAQLHADYTARLATVTGEVGATLGEMAQLAEQLAIARRDLPAARQTAERAEKAHAVGNLDERSYVDLVTTRFIREQDIMTLELALLDRQIALQTLVGAGLPSVTQAEAGQ